jgi:hypothetical protein
MKDRFDLEQGIMGCWSVVEDIKIVAEKYADDNDELGNLLLGIQALYQLKFENLFATFEDLIPSMDHRVGTDFSLKDDTYR